MTDLHPSARAAMRIADMLREHGHYLEAEQIRRRVEFLADCYPRNGPALALRNAVALATVAMLSGAKDEPGPGA